MSAGFSALRRRFPDMTKHVRSFIAVHYKEAAGRY